MTTHRGTRNSRTCLRDVLRRRATVEVPGGIVTIMLTRSEGRRGEARKRDEWCVVRRMGSEKCYSEVNERGLHEHIYTHVDTKTVTHTHTYSNIHTAHITCFLQHNNYHEPQLPRSTTTRAYTNSNIPHIMSNLIITKKSKIIMIMIISYITHHGTRYHYCNVYFPIEI